MPKKNKIKSKVKKNILKELSKKKVKLIKNRVSKKIEDKELIFKTKARVGKKCFSK